MLRHAHFYMKGGKQTFAASAKIVAKSEEADFQIGKKSNKLALGEAKHACNLRSALRHRLSAMNFRSRLLHHAGLTVVR
jgi:hypothetical protein